MALLQSISRWLRSSRTGLKSTSEPHWFRPTLEGMEDRLLLASAPPVGAPMLAGEWFVQSNGLSASIAENGDQLELTNGQGQQTSGQWLTATSFSAWGQTAQIVQNGPIREILWVGNVWCQSTWQEDGLAGQWFVQSNGEAASIVQSGTQLQLTNAQGQQTTGQWQSPTSFSAWGQTAQVVQNGAITQILWNGNVWCQSTWQEGGLAGQWFVQSNGGAASIVQNGTQLELTNAQGQQTTGQWQSPTSFSAWGQTAQIVQDGSITQIQWNGNVWCQSTWQEGGLAGQWFVQSNGGSSSIVQNGTQLELTNAQGQQTTGQWLSPTSFSAWGQTAQIVQNGSITQILWVGNVWSQSTWQEGGLVGQWFVQSNGGGSSIVQNGTQLELTNEQGQQTTGQWLSPTSFSAWGQTAQIVQDGSITQILWNGNVWSQSTWQEGGLAGQWFVQSNGGGASIFQYGTQLVLTNEQSQQTTGQWLSPTSFSAWGQTVQIVQNGSITQILWVGNVWSQSTWQEGSLAGQWFVQSNGGDASIFQYGTQLVLTNEQSQQTTGQWLSPTTFSAWGQTAQIVQNGSITQILWNGNVWSQSTWQEGSLTGQWFVQSNGEAASIVEYGTQLMLTNEQDQQTTGQWLSPTSFSAWGQTAQIVQNGSITQILWNGNVWCQSTWQEGGLAEQWFVKSNGEAASIFQYGTQLVLTNEQGQQTTGQWLSPTNISAWGQTAQIVQNGSIIQIQWSGTVWCQSTWQEGGLAGQWFVQSNGGAASIVQYGTQLVLTNEQGQQTIGQWLSPTSFSAWSQTVQIVQNGSVTQIQWNGNVWSQSKWQEGGLAGQWFVQSNGEAASILQYGSQLVLTNEDDQQTTGQWLSPTSFSAWSETVQIVQNGALTQIQWNGNCWSQSKWQEGGLAGQWSVQSNGGTASIVQDGTQLVLTNEQDQQTTGQWLSPTSFSAWGQTAQVVQNGSNTQIQWNGNVWSQSTINSGTPTSSVTALPAVEGNTSFPVAWSGQDSSGGSGIVSFSIYFSDNGSGYKLFQQSSTAGSAVFTGTPGHTYGFYSVATDEAGNVQPTPSSPQAITTVKLVTTTSVTSSSPKNTSASGQAITFTATVKAAGTGSNMAGAAGEEITFKAGSTVLGSSPLNSSGVATFTTTNSLAGGNQTITAVYNGDNSFQGSTGTLQGGQTVHRAGTSINLTSSSPKNTSIYGQAVTFTATVGVTRTGLNMAEAAGEKVTFKGGSTVLGSSPLNSSGVATFTTTSPLAEGNQTITAVFSGDSVFAASSSTLPHGQTVNPAATSIKLSSSAANDTSDYNQQVTFTATVTTSSPGAGTPSGPVSFYDGSTFLGRANLTKGKATFTTSSPLPVGQDKIKAVFDDATDKGAHLNADYQSSSTTLVQVVKSTGPTDVSSQVSVLKAVYRRVTGKPYTYTEVVTLTNGSKAITGPIYLELNGLPSGVSLYNASGKTAGVPFIEAASGNLAAKASISLTLEFLDPSLVSLSFTTKVVAGASP